MATSEIAFEELLPDLGRFRTYFPECATSILMAAAVVHGPEAGDGVLFGEGEPLLCVGEPFLGLRFRTEGKTS